MRFTNLLLALSLSLLLGGTAFAQTATPVASPADAVKVMVAAVTARDANAIAALYSDDALMLGPNAR